MKIIVNNVSKQILRRETKIKEKLALINETDKTCHSLNVPKCGKEKYGTNSNWTHFTRCLYPRIRLVCNCLLENETVLK